MEKGETMMSKHMTAARVWSACTLVAGCWLAGMAPVRAQDGLRGTIQIKGSDTMVNLAQAWAEAFMTQHPGVTVAVTGGGSGTGIAALISGTCDLATSSRKITPKEIRLAERQGHAPNEIVAALDGIAVVVHPNNPVKQLTLEQLAKIFTGVIRNWRDVGGPDQEIVLLSREVNSGTHVYFKEHVLGSVTNGPKEFAPEALLLPSSQAIADEVASNPAAIGYYGMGYQNPKNAVMAIARTDKDPYIPPSEETVRSGAYPISRPLLLYSRGDLKGAVKAFVEFALSSQGQAVVHAIDFVPLAAR